MTHSVRALCPFCKSLLSGEIERVSNYYKLDNGDPDFIERTVCPNCKKYVQTVNSGSKLVAGYEKRKR